MVARFDRDVVARGPVVATINVGINDVWHRLEAPHEPQVLADYRANLERMVRMALDAGIRVLLLAPTVIEEDRASEGNRRLASYVAAGREIAARNACVWADLHELFLRVVDRRGRSGQEDKAGPLTRDGVHMNPIGDVLMAVGLLRALGVPDEKMAATDLTGVFE
jgi:lysophospholipase L1-like esterase